MEESRSLKLRQIVHGVRFTWQRMESSWSGSAARSKWILSKIGIVIRRYRRSANDQGKSFVSTFNLNLKG